MKKHNSKYKQKHQLIDKNATMSTQDIVQTSVEKYYPDQDWKNVYAHLYLLVQKNTHRILREGNTLFFYKINGKTAEECYLFTGETDPKKIIHSFKEGVKALKIGGFKKVDTDVLDPQIIRLARMSKLDVKSKSVDGSYHLEVTL
jgi:hypothetical protein